jgi:CO dehydrogenase/acetyl-CoA synthase epsilon subunit
VSVVSDKSHAILSESVKMLIKQETATLIVYGVDLVPAIQMVFPDANSRDEFYKKLVEVMGT